MVVCHREVAYLLTTMADVQARVRDDPALDAVLQCVRQRASDDPGHDLGHSLRVAAWTLRLLPSPADQRAAIAAALLHDVVNVPKDSPERARASELSAEAARPVLEHAGFGSDAIATICDAIRDHSFSSGRAARSDLGRALQDADRLEALGALGIFRTISTGVTMGAKYFHPEDPWARRRALDDRRYTIDHFFTKLLHLPSRMNTVAGRTEAERRVAFLRAFLDELGRELDCNVDGSK
jgi:uncharacterized protein